MLDSVFPGSKHVKDFGLTDNDDEAVWELALREGFVIVSKDSDFLHRSLLRGQPPKVIQVRMGNCSTRQIHELFTREEGTIKDFLKNPNEALLIIS